MTFKTTVMGLASVFLLVAGCGDSESSGGTGGGTTSATTGTPSSSSAGMTTASSTSATTAATTNAATTSTASGSTATGMLTCALPDTTAPTTCAEACSDLYDCGALTCNGEQNCPGYSGDPQEKAFFVGDANSNCIQGCMAQMALIGLVEPMECDVTIAALSGIDAVFQDACQNGFK